LVKVSNSPEFSKLISELKSAGAAPTQARN